MGSPPLDTTAPEPPLEGTVGSPGGVQGQRPCKQLQEETE
jgi:hypothetical protein